MKYILISIFAAGLITIAACKKNTPAPTPIPVTYDNYFTIDGGAYKNVLMNFKTVSSSAGAYSASLKGTSVEIKGANDSLELEFSILFEGNKTGNFSLGTGTDYITVRTAPISNPGNTTDYSSNPNGVIKITEYGAVGGKIAGTFGGEFNSVGTNFTITNGTFSVVRAADQP